MEHLDDGDGEMTLGELVSFLEEIWTLACLVDLRQKRMEKKTPGKLPKFQF